MRRVLLTLVTAGSLAVAPVIVLAIDSSQDPKATQLTTSSKAKNMSTQLAQSSVAEAATTVPQKQTPVRAEDDSNLSILGALFSTLTVMVTIAFRRSRSRSRNS